MICGSKNQKGPLAISKGTSDQWKGASSPAANTQSAPSARLVPDRLFLVGLWQLLLLDLRLMRRLIHHVSRGVSVGLFG